MWNLVNLLCHDLIAYFFLSLMIEVFALFQIFIVNKITITFRGGGTLIYNNLIAPPSKISKKACKACLLITHVTLEPPS